MKEEDGPKPSSVDRRRFLMLAGGASVGLVGGGCGSPAGTSRARETSASALAGPSPDETPIFAPKVNGGINLHAVRRLDVDPNESDPVIVPELVVLQLRAAYELGFDGIRVTAPGGDRANFLAAIPYVRAARALGIDAVVVLSNLEGITLARALWDPRRRPEVLRMYDQVLATPPPPAAPGAGGLGPGGAGRIAFQVLNEPALFVGVPPDVYVHEIFEPCASDLNALNPHIIVVAAAEVGTLDGPPRMRAMLEAGLEVSCDRIAYHVYHRQVIPQLSFNVRRLVWVTESGTAGTAGHLAWVRDTFEEMRAQIGDLSRIFYYDLYDAERGVYRLIDLQQNGSTYRAVVESVDLYAYFSRNVREAAAGRPVLPFETLIPDIRAYFPTAADAAAYDEVFVS